MTGEEPRSGNVLRRRRGDPPGCEREELPGSWREVIETYKSPGNDQGNPSYPRWQRLFDIVREDGRVKLMLDYDQENPSPDFADYGQRRQVESLLGFERPLESVMIEAGRRWLAGDYEGEATLLEEFAKSNPQSDAILSLADEARRDALSGASSRTKPRRRDIR